MHELCAKSLKLRYCRVRCSARSGVGVLREHGMVETIANLGTTQVLQFLLITDLNL